MRNGYADCAMTSCQKKDLCGSCAWSHIPYQKQLDQKISDINGSFKMKDLNLRCEEILSSPKRDHYRNRMDFAIDFEGRVGLREKGKWWRVIDGHACFLADEKIEKLFEQVRPWVKECGWSFYDRKSHKGFLRAAVIRSTTLGQPMLNIVTSAPRQPNEFLKNGPFTNMIWSINHTDADVSFGDEIHVLAGQPFLEERINGIVYRISPGAFFQTNSHAAPLLVKTVEEVCGDVAQKTVLDMYGGAGIFSVALGSGAKRTMGIESDRMAIEDAKINARINRINAEYLIAPVESYDWSVHHPDVVILDPPRSGMPDRALLALLRIKPKQLVYVSCNPKNFAREMVLLNQSYRVEALRAIDLFPHTPHVELVTKLVLR